MSDSRRDCAACGYSVVPENWDNHTRGQTHRLRARRWADRMLDHQMADLIRALDERNVQSVGDLVNYERQMAADAFALGMGSTSAHTLDLDSPESEDSQVSRMTEADRRATLESRLLGVVSGHGGERIIAGPPMEAMVRELADVVEGWPALAARLSEGSGS